MNPVSVCIYCDANIEWDGERWVDQLSDDDGGTFDWCPNSPHVTDNEPSQPHKARN